MAHYTSKLFLKSAENYSIMDKKYISQKGEKNAQFWIKKLYFQKFNVLNVNKSPIRFELMICTLQAR